MHVHIYVYSIMHYACIYRIYCTYTYIQCKCTHTYMCICIYNTIYMVYIHIHRVSNIFFQEICEATDFFLRRGQFSCGG